MRVLQTPVSRKSLSAMREGLAAERRQQRECEGIDDWIASHQDLAAGHYLVASSGEILFHCEDFGEFRHHLRDNSVPKGAFTVWRP